MRVCVCLFSYYLFQKAAYLRRSTRKGVYNTDGTLGLDKVDYVTLIPGRDNDCKERDAERERER